MPYSAMRISYALTTKLGVFVALTMIFVGAALRIPILARSLHEPMLYGFRQTQTAMMANEYGKDLGAGWSPLPIFGAQSQVPMEFPAFQWLVGLLVQLTSIDVGIATRLLALFFFQVSAFAAFLLARRFFGGLVAILTVALLEFTPFALLWSAAALIESCAVAFALLGILAMIASAEKQQWPYQLGATILMGLAFLIKPTTAILWVPVALVAYFCSRKSSVRISVSALHALVPVSFGLLLSVIWTHFADDMKESNPLTLFLTSGNLSSWNFGSVSQRLELQSWASIVDRSPWSGMSWLLVVAPIIALLTGRSRPVTVALAFVFPFGVLVFFNLYWVHIYYAMAAYPSLCILVAIAVCGLVGFFVGGWARILLSSLVVSAIVAGLWISPDGINTAKRLTEKFDTPLTSIAIKDHTPPNAQILLFGCDWDPTTLFFANRSGLMIRNTEEAKKIGDGDLVGRPFFVTSCGGTLSSDQILSELPAGNSLQEVGPGVFRIVGFGS